MGKKNNLYKKIKVEKRKVPKTKSHIIFKSPILIEIQKIKNNYQSLRRKIRSKIFLHVYKKYKALSIKVQELETIKKEAGKPYNKKISKLEKERLNFRKEMTKVNERGQRYIKKKDLKYKLKIEKLKEQKTKALKKITAKLNKATEIKDKYYFFRKKKEIYKKFNVITKIRNLGRFDKYFKNEILKKYKTNIDALGIIDRNLLDAHLLETYDIYKKTKGQIYINTKFDIKDIDIIINQSFKTYKNNK